MSQKAGAWAREHLKFCTGGPTSKIVLLLMADYADREHALFPSVATLADDIGAPDRTVQRAIRDLEADKLVRRETRSTTNGKNASNRYVLAVAGEAEGACMGDMVSPLMGDMASPSPPTPCHHDGDAMSPSTTLEPRTLTSETSDEVSVVCVGERAAREEAFGKLEAAWVAKAPSRSDEPKSRTAFEAACDDGEDAALIVGGALRYLAESRDAKAGHVPLLHNWLGGKRWRGFEPKAEPAKAALPTFAVTALDDGPLDFRLTVRPEQLFGCGWDDAERAIVVTTTFAAERLRRDLRRQLAEFRINVIVRKPA